MMNNDGHRNFFPLSKGLPWASYDDLGRRILANLPSNQEDLTGRKFGRLIAISYAGRNDYGNHVWLCRCNCGNEKIIYKGSLLKNPGGVKSCGCLQKEITSKRASKENNATANALYSEYRSSARKRDLLFKLSKNQFLKLTSQDCYYCGALPSCVRKVKSCIKEYTYNGIDRVDNNVGYIPENCVPCCSRCNKSKHTMTKNDFLSWVSDVYNNRIMQKGKNK